MTYQRVDSGRMRMPNSSRFVRFPSVPLGSYAEFEAYRENNRSQLDGRYLHETALASNEPTISRPGSCAMCLRATTYTSATTHGERQPDGRVMPNWREEQYCDCEDRLPQRGRALLHFAQATKTLQPWTRLLLFGRATAFDGRLAAAVRTTSRIPRMYATGGEGRRAYRIDAEDDAFHVVVSSDALQRIPPLTEALAEIHRVLAPGGRLIFTVPFHFMNRHTISHLDTVAHTDGSLPVEVEADVHAIGWDIIDRLHEAGFEDAQAHTYWSDELGYLGSFKTIFMAVR
jgi:SAM-dependent methyltransferase